MKSIIITLSKTEFVEKDGKLYHKEIHREIRDDNKDQPWEERASQLRLEGKKFREIADILNLEGYKTTQGLPIQTGTICNRNWYKSKK